ncbi:MAG: helicase-exonuclease AddAB subunit AddA [Paraclostridium sp.]|uniref:helicase-exonuclease AddAB subunit AddA n=1 Tax=Paraclostridium sp. TaxID=2023273 RepID=UPI003F311867
MSSPKWTEEQQAVIDSRNCNLLVAAAAGSGKTAVLVERIIKIITDTTNPIDIDKLLVVTFTNAAASEMRERVGDAIAKALDENPENSHLQNQLILLNRASITTIHSFCLDVIKSNFHKINIDPNFRIGDQTECTLLKQECIEEVFEDYYEAKNIEFLSLVESYAEKRGDKELQEIILSIYNFSMASPYPEKWLYDSAELFNIDDDFDFSSSIWAQAILDTVKIEMNGIEASMRKAIACVDGLEELESYKEKLSIEYSKIVDIVKACDNGWDSTYYYMSNMKFENFAKGVKRLSKDAPEYIKQARENAKNIRDKNKKSLESIIGATFYKSNSQVYNEIKYLYPVVKSISDLIVNFEKRYQEKKREKGIIDFNDIEHFALAILTDTDDNGNIIPSDAAKVYIEKFSEIFIDEYQDSNLVQEVLLSTIAKVENPNRFMVGDVKQSIYRFRQAKPEIFLEKYANYDTKKGSANRKIMLYKNFRSRKEVVDSANYIFENIMSRNIGEIEYNQDERLNLGASFKECEEENAIVGGSTEIHLIQKNSKSEELSDEEEEEQEEIDNIQLEARMLGKIIKNIMKPDENGKIMKVYDKRVDKYRNVDFKDIVILLRATSSWAPVFVDELMNMDIPTYADTGIGYFDTVEIKTILALLQIIDNPMQDIPLIAVLKSPMFGFTPEELIDIRIEDRNKSFYEVLQISCEKENELSEKVRYFIEKLDNFKVKSMYMSTDEFLWYLYVETGYYAYVGALPAGIQRQANLKVLFERAKQFEATSFKGLFNFINFVKKLKRSNSDMGSAKTLGENANVVRIMSIHKSKGLEFPIVICAGMGKNFNNQDFRKDILYHHKLGYGPQLVDYNRKISYPSIAKEALKTTINMENLSEEMRVLYVAFTRPKEKLIITGSVRDIQSSVKKWGESIADAGPISEYQILKGKNFLDWIMPAVLKHKDLNDIRELVELEYNGFTEHDSKWKTRIWDRSDILVNKDNIQENESIDSILVNMDLKKDNSDYYNLINDKLDFKYPFMESVNRAATISVTEIKQLENRREDDYIVQELIKKPTEIKKPLFIQESETSNKMTGAQKGTIMHLFMQIIDLNKVDNINDIKDEIELAIKKNILTQTQADAINPYKVLKFFKSNLGKRMTTSHFLKREQAFYLQLNIKDVFDFEDDEKKLENDDTLMVRGIIDAYFEENDEIVIIDYKTDFVNEENREDVINRYTKQLEIYSKALNQLTGKLVKEAYIYLFGSEEEICYKF